MRITIVIVLLRQSRRIGRLRCRYSSQLAQFVVERITRKNSVLFLVIASKAQVLEVPSVLPMFDGGECVHQQKRLLVVRRLVNELQASNYIVAREMRVEQHEVDVERSRTAKQTKVVLIEVGGRIRH